MRSGGGLLVFVLLSGGLLLAGCVTRQVGRSGPVLAGPAPQEAKAEERTPPADPADAMADMDLRLRCDRARVVIPERLRKAVVPMNDCAAPPHLFIVRDVQIETREAHTTLEVAGDDFTIVAEGGVLLTLREGGKTAEEGPYGTVVVKNGTILRR